MSKRDVPIMFYIKVAASIRQPQAYRRRIRVSDVLTLAIVVLVIIAVCWFVAAAGDGWVGR
jgi:hypothetical protein